MTILIIASLGLALIQFWLLPATLSLKNFSYLISSRDTPLEQSILQGRVSRAAANYQESWPAFLTLSVIAMIQHIDLSQLAFVWLALRVVYVLCYMFNLIYVRTVVWLASLACLVLMACELV